MLDNRKSGASPSDYQDISPVDNVLRDELPDAPSLEWLEGQSPEVRAYHSGQLERLTIIGVEDPQARALELAWNYAQSMNEGGK